MVWIGWPAASRSRMRFQSLRAITELGYDCCSEPRLLTTSAAVQSRLIPANRGDAHADCALSCAKRGAVLGIRTDEGVYTITGEYTFEQNKRLIPLVARQVVATGEVSETEELRTIRIASIELAK